MKYRPLKFLGDKMPQVMGRAVKAMKLRLVCECGKDMTMIGKIERKGELPRYKYFCKPCNKIFVGNTLYPTIEYVEV